MESENPLFALLSFVVALSPLIAVFTLLSSPSQTLDMPRKRGKGKGRGGPPLNEGSRGFGGGLPKGGAGRKQRLMEIASTTLKAFEHGSYEVDGTVYDLKESVDLMKRETVLYPADSELSEWDGSRREKVEGELEDARPEYECEMMVLEISALDGGRLVKNVLVDAGEQGRIGMLNFASAKNPGGGFLNGAQAQEESIARSSTIYGSLMTDVAQRFYLSHRKDPKEGYYSHAIIWSPHAQVVRNDAGDWLPPVEIEMVTSCAVNAGVARRKIHDGDESEIEATMRERMARVLYVFEKQGVENLVLGSFGTGVFRNNVAVVARIWHELLVGDNARFRRSFRRVVFAILGHPTYLTFKETFKGVTGPVSSP